MLSALRVTPAPPPTVGTGLARPRWGRAGIWALSAAGGKGETGGGCGGGGV